MKREKISLFILVVEIVVIAFLHSAKNTRPGVNEQLTKGNTAASTYQLKATVPVTTIAK